MAEENEKGIGRKFKWIIDDVTREKLEAPKLKLYSKPFSVDIGDNKTEWKGLIQKDEEDNLGVYFIKSKVSRDDFSLKYSVHLHDVKRSTSKEKSTVYKNGWGWSKFITFDKLFDPSLKYLENGSKMEFIFDIKFYQQQEEEKVVSNNYSKYFNDTKLADFTLISSDGEPFQVHRFVLAYESEFFEKMFTIDMQEKQQGSVKFEDIDSEALKDTLEFIYNGEVDIDDVEKASGVTDAAEKFMLPGLKKICCETLYKELNKDNAIKILAIADMYNEKELEDLCLEIIIDDYDYVKHTEDWKSLTVPLYMKITDALVAALNAPVITLYSSLESTD